MGIERALRWRQLGRNRGGALDGNGLGEVGDTQRDGKSIGSAWRHAQPGACVRGKAGGPDLNCVSTGGQVGHGEMTVRIRDGFLYRASDFVLDYDRGGRKGFAGL